ncbi:MAG: ABC transporter ATP-binding protein [Clostridiales bacterium]|jgi:putative ABC transport system ATP-binding protein|nr:ABC transporter ATP-binding protein [Clostridiales bacterium]
MITVENLTKSYGGFFALSDVSFDVEKGDYIAVTGRSGSGKSTLFHIIGGLDRPTDGAVIFEGRNSINFSEKEMARYRNLEIGFVFQSFHLEPSYTVYKNLEIPLLIAGIDKNTRDERIRLNADKLGIADKLNNLANNLSGGEKQRVAIARALMNNPKVILADEPCGNLDSLNAEKIMDIFTALNNEGITVLLITHHIKDAQRAKKIINLLDGEIVYEDRK